jgi:2-methylisocitrate lyase-like PEP mutase family enzyme
MVGKEVIPVEDMVAKIRVAVDTKNRIDPDFQIIARCDALGAHNAGTLEETIERMQAYEAAGADAISFEAPESREQIRIARKALKGPMTLPPYNLEKELTLQEAGDLGLYSLIMLSVNANIYQFIWEFLKAVKGEGHNAVRDFKERIPTTTEGLQYPGRAFSGLAHILEMEEKYLPKGFMDRYEKTQGGFGVYDPRSGETGDIVRR